MSAEWGKSERWGFAVHGLAITRMPQLETDFPSLSVALLGSSMGMVQLDLEIQGKDILFAVPHTTPFPSATQCMHASSLCVQAAGSTSGEEGKFSCFWGCVCVW